MHTASARVVCLGGLFVAAFMLSTCRHSRAPVLPHAESTSASSPALQVALAASGDDPAARARPDEELHPYTRAILEQPPPPHLLVPFCPLFLW